MIGKSDSRYYGSLSYANYSKYSTEQLQRLVKKLSGSDKEWCKIELKSRQNKNGNFKGAKK
jgi:hypothetical protein